MTSIFFQAAGKPVQAIIASMIRDIICFIPLILILPSFFGIEGILFAAPIADFIAVIVAAALTAAFMKSLKDKAMPKNWNALQVKIDQISKTRGLKFTRVFIVKKQTLWYDNHIINSTRYGD